MSFSATKASEGVAFTASATSTTTVTGPVETGSAFGELCALADAEAIIATAATKRISGLSMAQRYFLIVSSS
jgi:hypothetical protein